LGVLVVFVLDRVDEEGVAGVERGEVIEVAVYFLCVGC